MMASELLDRAPVLSAKVAVACDVTPERVGTILEELVKFLVLCSRSHLPLSPSRRIDNVWHEVILCTRVYGSFCEAHFGRWIHHDPSEPSSSNHANWNRTQRMYAHYFGVMPCDLWGVAENDHLVATCGGCESLDR